MTIIRLSSVFVVVIVATKLMIFTADDARAFEIRWLSELEHEFGELIDEAVRYRAERRESVEGGMFYAMGLRRFAIRMNLVTNIRRWAEGAVRQSIAAMSTGHSVHTADSLQIHRVTGGWKQLRYLQVS